MSEEKKSRKMVQSKVMGILNVTPDSFSDGGRFKSSSAAARRGSELIEAGADIIDIGGESTRPGAKEISTEQELKRTIGVVERLRDIIDKRPNCAAQLSIDTRKPEVARAAIKAGAHIWNDVSALTYSKKSVATAAKLGCDVILMHAMGPPETMQDNPTYEDVIAQIRLYLATRVAETVASGVQKDKITIDPGIGFGKRLEDNLAILHALAAFEDIGCKLLIGASRKNFISGIDGSDVNNRIGGSLASALWAVNHGAHIVRVHDVAETLQALKVWKAIENG